MLTWINDDAITGLRVEICKPNGEVALAKERSCASRADRFDFFFTHYTDLLDEARANPELDDAKVAIVVRH
jgi:hypothetical protein